MAAKKSSTTKASQKKDAKKTTAPSSSSTDEDVQHLTQEGYDKLAAELHDLKQHQLPAILERLKEAIAQGDISENAEYEQSQEDRNIVNGRISYLEDLLANVQIIDASKRRNDEVRYGSVVTIDDIEKQRTHEITVVGTNEVDIDSGYISFHSPLGVALKGKKKGDVVKVNAPRGKYEVKIVSIA